MKRARRAKTYKPARSLRVVRKRSSTADSAPSCTNPSIDESVQAPTVQEMQIGAFRKGLKSVLDGERAVILGNSWRPRGIVVPVRSRWQYKVYGEDARRACLMQLFEAALNQLDR